MGTGCRHRGRDPDLPHAGHCAGVGKSGLARPGRLPPGPLDVAALHHADDPHPGPQPGARHHAFLPRNHCPPGAASEIQEPVHRARLPDLRCDFLCLLGSRLRTQPDGRHLLCRGGRAPGDRHRLPVSAGHHHRRLGALAIRPFGQRAAARGHPGPFSRKHDRHRSPLHHHLVAGGHHPRGGLLRRRDSGGVLDHAEDRPPDFRISRIARAGQGGRHAGPSRTLAAPELRAAWKTARSCPWPWPSCLPAGCTSTSW